MTTMLIYYIFRPRLHGHFSLAQTCLTFAKVHPKSSLTSGNDAVFILGVGGWCF